MTKTICKSKIICCTGFTKLDVSPTEIFIHNHRLEEFKINSFTGTRTLYICVKQITFLFLFFSINLSHLLHTNSVELMTNLTQLMAGCIAAVHITILPYTFNCIY